MIKRILPRLAALGMSLAAAVPAAAEDFDYYLLALSWSPSWCDDAGNDDAEQCAPSRDLGFVLHGLWPQFEAGWPEWCEPSGRDPAARDPSRRETAAMADVMGSGGLAWYQWRKHGRCAGLDPADYFAGSRAAFAALDLPRVRGGAITAAALRAGLLAANPRIPEDGLVVTCRGGQLQEVRVCLTTELEPRSCGRDVLEDACQARGPIEMPAP